MSAKTDAFENSLLDLIFTNADLAGIGDATGLQGSTVAGSLYVSLHTSSPGETGNQTTNECTYTSYARVAVARSGSGWTVTGDTVSNAAAVTFPEATGGSETATHFGIGTDSSGTGNLLYHGALDTSRAISAGVTPEFAIGALDVTEA